MKFSSGNWSIPCFYRTSGTSDPQQPASDRPRELSTFQSRPRGSSENPLISRCASQLPNSTSCWSETCAPFPCSHGDRWSTTLKVTILVALTFLRVTSYALCLLPGTSSLPNGSPGNSVSMATSGLVRETVSTETRADLGFGPTRPLKHNKLNSHKTYFLKLIDIIWLDIIVFED